MQTLLKLRLRNTTSFMKNRKEKHYFSQTGPGGRKCACCSPAPGPERKQFDRQAKRRERQYWKKEAEELMAKLCPACKKEILVPSEEMRNKLNGVYVCDSCYYSELGQWVEEHPIRKPGTRRGHGRCSKDC